MGSYVIKRILMMIPIILMVIFIVFTIMALTPGSPGRLILGETAPQAAVDQLNETLGYNKPFFSRFFNYILDILHGNFGNSYRTRRPVFDEIKTRMPVTLCLSVFSMLILSSVGVLVGILSAVKQYSSWDYFSRVMTMMLAAMPVFWFGLMMILLFALKLRWLPSYGDKTWKHFILPIATVVLPSLANVVRMTRSTMLETIRQDYIRTARAKGAPENRVIMLHALKNALLPIITVIGITFGHSLGGAVLTESVYSLNGIGLLIVDSIRNKDVPQVMSAIIVLSTLFTFIMLTVDLLYAFVDPRIRAQYQTVRRRAHV